MTPLNWLTFQIFNATRQLSHIEAAPTLLYQSINENSTVQYIVEQLLKASSEIGQEYAIVTFDLAVAKKAYALVW